MFLGISQNFQEKTCARVSILIKLQAFSCEFCEISKSTFFTEHVWATGRPPPKDRLTSFAELETESDEVLSSSQSSSEKEPFEPYVEKASETERLIEENKQLRTKCECLQKKNNTRFFIRKFFIRK